MPEPIAITNELLEQIEEILLSNGSIPQSKRDKVLFSLLRAIAITVRDLPEHDGRIKDLEKMANTVKWVGGIIIVMMVTLVFEMITHRLSFP